MLKERLKIMIPTFSCIALLSYMVNMDEPFIESILFFALGGGALTLFLYLHAKWQRIVSLLVSFLFFTLCIIWTTMSEDSLAFSGLRDQVLWLKCTTQEEKLDYLYTENWDHDRAVSVYSRMSPAEAMDELDSKVRFGLDMLVVDYEKFARNYANITSITQVPMKSVPAPHKYLNIGRLILALQESGFLTPANATKLADMYFKEYPFSELEEGSEDWDVALGMLDCCSEDCLRTTLLVDRAADLPPDIANYINQLLPK